MRFGGISNEIGSVAGACGPWRDAQRTTESVVTTEKGMFRNYLQRLYRTIVPMIYRKSNYKLFLQRSFVQLNGDVRRIALATDVLSSVVRPIMLNAPLGRSMLVVAPHQDDEIIGCGGALLLQLKAGRRASVVFVQDGGNEHEESGLSREQLVGLREVEANRVADALQIDRPLFLRQADVNRRTVPDIAAALRAELERTQADCVMVPFFLDYNTEHQYSNVALAEALASVERNVRVFGYEVWGLCVANTALVIDSVMARKQELLSYYQSQISGTDYVNAVTGLNMYRSRALGAGTCKYLECYFEIPSSEYVPLIRKIYPEHDSNQ